METAAIALSGLGIIVTVIITVWRSSVASAARDGELHGKIGAVDIKVDALSETTQSLKESVSNIRKVCGERGERVAKIETANQDHDRRLTRIEAIQNGG